MNYSFKLYEMVAVLSAIEVRQLRKMLNSTFFTRREDLRVLFNCLMKIRQKGKTFPKLETLYYQVFPDLPWEGSRMRGTMSDLVELIEECLMINAYRKDRVGSKLKLSNIYRRRNLDKCFSGAMKKTNSLLEEQPKRNADYYRHLLELQIEKMQQLSSTKRSEHLLLQEISDTHDILFLIQKLQVTCAQLSHQLVKKKDYDFGLLIDLVERIDQERYLKIPAIAIYFNCFKFLTETDNIGYFQKFKILLEQFDHHFSNEDLKAPYRLAINFCIRKTNEGVSSFISDSWDLYKKGISEGILLENNYIPRFTFNNAIAAAIRLNELDWIETFIAENSQQLESTFKDSTISFNRARLEYERKNYGKALIHLQSTETKDVMNNMISKILLVKIYFELKELDALNYHLDSFEQFIRRNAVSDYHKSNVLNIVKFMRKNMSVPKYNKEERERLRSQIKTETILSERSWLLEKI